MKKFFKRAAIAALIVGVVAVGINFPNRTAEAFDLGDLGRIFQIFDKTDINTAKKRMLDNFSYSTALLAAAYQNVRIATDDSIANRELITNERAIRNALNSTDAGTNLKNGAAQGRQDAERAKKYLQDALASGDEEKLARIDEYVKVADNQRLVSDVMANVSYTQAGLIIAEQIRNVTSGNLQSIGNVMNVVHEIQGMLKIRGELSGLLKTATEEYRKNRGIKPPTKKEQEQAAEQIEKG